MKKANNILFLLIIFFISISNVNASTTGVINASDGINVRKTVNGSIETALNYKTTVTVTSTNEGSTSNCKVWYKITYGKYNDTGYVCGEFIDLLKGYASCVENDDPLNIWSDTNKSSKKAQVKCDKEMTILDKDISKNSKCSKNWYKVSYNGIEGYACSTYVYTKNNTSSNNTSSSSSPNTNATYTKKPTTGDNIYNKDNYNSKLDGDGSVVCYEDTGDLNLKTTAGGSNSGNKVKCGDIVTINDVQESSGSCPYYYKITNSSKKTGWVCGYYINTTKLSKTAENYYNSKESLEEYYKTLKNKGFPDSYLSYLAEIHARHPNWVFNAEKINLNFNDVVANEAAYGRNLLQGSAFNNNYYSMDLNTYDILNDKFSDYPTEAGWYNASEEAIAFYLDPRNYLNEKYIFAFESLEFNSEHDKNTISKILSGQTFWPTVYNNYSSNVADDIITATKSVGISSVHIASRIKQEISGISTSDPRLGGTFTYNNKNYSGYYNFFNIKVYGTNKIVNGMKYAMDNGWNTPYNGIKGGTSFIYDGYVGVNQDTMYYEKFDVSTTNGHYTHQYMQNLAAAVQETNSTYSSYVNLNNYLTKAISFTIPVYNNMSNYAVTSPSIGNPNNYLKDLKINGTTISGFSYDTYNYTLTVPANTTSIDVSATKINSLATISGTGKKNLTSTNTEIKIIVTAASGRTRTYTIKVNKPETTSSNNNQTNNNQPTQDNTKQNETNNNNNTPSTNNSTTPNNNDTSDNNVEDNIIELSKILNNIGVKYNNNYMYGIKENSNVTSLINNTTKISPYASITIKEASGKAKNSGILKTGDKVTISNSKESKTYNIVIYGDINGDGKIDKNDTLSVIRQIKGYTNLKDAYKLAADANKDGKIDKNDTLSIIRQIKGFTTLN